jgi:aryl-alcohol dehydrogenase-like predicted oxidoreductase
VRIEPGLAAFPHRELGRTGLMISPIGVGNGSLGVTAESTTDDERDEIAVEALRAAIDAGLNYVDTCPQYRDGDSDRRVGLALADGWRDRAIVSVKVGTHPSRPNDYSYGATLWSMERNLEVLGTDHVEVALFHDPHQMDEILSNGGGLEALERLKDENTIRAMGLAVQNHQFQRQAIESGRFDVLLIPYDYNLIRTTASPNLDLATEAGMGCIVASPYQQGLLAVADPDEANEVRKKTGSWLAREGDLEKARALWNWAHEHGADLRAMAVQFCIREPRIASTLVGPRSASEVLAAIASATTAVPEEHWETLMRLLPNLPDPSPGGEASVGPHPPAM